MVGLIDYACNFCNGGDDCSICNGSGLLRMPGGYTGAAPPVRSRIKRVLVDLDDTLVDCEGAFMRHMGLVTYGVLVDHPDGMGRDAMAAYEVETGVLYDPDTFWQHFGRDFWATLPPLPGMFCLLNLIEELVGIENAAICTTPTEYGDCLAGKSDWIQTYLPERWHRQYILTPIKSFCATPTTLLIDDQPINCEEFREEGGMAIEYPRPWNVNREHVIFPIHFIQNEIDKLNTGVIL